MDARLCISYLTIEHRSAVPEELRRPMGRHVFGCDICQDVCPWNRRAPITQAQEFQPRTFPRPVECESNDSPAVSTSVLQEESLFLPRLEWLAGMNEEQFRSTFRENPIKRTKWCGLVRNACIALGNSASLRGTPHHSRVCALLKRLATSREPLISDSAQWALARIQ
jgi:epoxyqueuosine reductase